MKLRLADPASALLPGEDRTLRQVPSSSREENSSEDSNAKEKFSEEPNETTTCPACFVATVRHTGT
ncbi:hypothetical protein, partial [Defluviimonas sp. WL0075]